MASEEVLRELETGSDDLYDWARAHPRMFIPLSNDIQEAVTNILKAHPQWVPADRSRNMADPFVVVAVAIVKGCSVVSAELWSQTPYPERVKIPNVCATFGIQHYEFLEMMREQGWVFTR